MDSDTDPTAINISDESISSYMSFTNTHSISQARQALQKTNGNLEAAVEAYLDSNSNSNSSPIHKNQDTSSNQEGLTSNKLSRTFNQNHSSNSAHHHYPPRSSRSTSDRNDHSNRSARSSSPKFFSILFRLCMGPLRLIAIPISFTADLGLTVCSLLARLFGFRLPPSMSIHWPGSKLFSWTDPPQRIDPKIAAERWVRELEEELQARSSYTPAQPGDPIMPRLPEFLLLGYDDAVLKAKDELKVLMIVLISQEHDETDQFKRGTLMNEELLNLIRDNDILVWGGDVKERDASIAAYALNATTYPFVAFVSLQPKGPSSMVRSITSSSHRSTTSSNMMAICTKLEGSVNEATSCRSICRTINSTVLPRTKGYLNRLKSERIQREMDRKLREEQDRAYLEAGRKDLERVLKKKAELEAEQRRIEELKLKEIERERLKNLKLEEDEQRRRWRYWARKEMMLIEPSSGGITIGFRLGNGKRVIRKFKPDEPIESLYLFVELESSSLSTNHHSKDHGDNQETIDLPRPRSDYKHCFNFKLSTAMPRRILPLPSSSSEEGEVSSSNKSSLTISQFGELDGANLNVEGSLSSSHSDEEEEDDDDDDDENDD